MTGATTTAIAEAIEELRATFPETEVVVEPDGAGGAWVTISSVPMGSAFLQSESWMAFQLTFPYPEADVYPLFVRADLVRRDGAAHGQGFAATTWGPRGEACTQLSRRSNRLDPAVDTAATKVLKVIQWLEQQ
ncbi:hypothetical protein GCM10028798_03100 [Humibacter antri]